jgi:hypothetical protein
MKKNLVFIFFLIYPISIFSQNILWDYPIKPGTPEWGQLHNQELKVQASQIPEGILKNLSSENLINVYFKYPLLINILFFPTFQKGMEDFKTNFNGYGEMCLRSDIPDLLVKRYLLSFAGNIDNSWTSLKKGDFAFKFISLELLLSQSEILSKLTYNDRKNLLIKSVMNLDEKRKNVQVHDRLGLKSSCFLIIEILLEFNEDFLIYSPEQLNLLEKSFNSTSTYDDDKILQIIELTKYIIPNL